MSHGHNRKHRSSLVKLSIFMVLSAFFAFFLVVLTGNVRLTDTHSYSAVLANASQLKDGSEVRVAGVQVGTVDGVSLRPDSKVVVTFDADTSIHLTTSTRATVRYKNLLGDRFLELDEGTAGGTPLRPGGVIPLSRTSGALDLDTLLNGFKPLFVGLAPKQINLLSGELVQVLQGQSGAVYDLLATLASFTTTIANRDALIGEVIDNLNTVLGTVATRDDTVGTLIDQLESLVGGLAAQVPTITRAVTRIDTFASSASALLSQTESNLTPDLRALTSVAATLNRNTDTIQQILDKLPGAYRTILRTGSFGDFFNFFLCGVRLKLADDNGVPVYTPWNVSDAARCH
jgi:phospholipid/cholesterol/gamma-HCH transport system substrate-binding protein